MKITDMIGRKLNHNDDHMEYIPYANSNIRFSILNGIMVWSHISIAFLPQKIYPIHPTTVEEFFAERMKMSELGIACEQDYDFILLNLEFFDTLTKMQKIPSGRIEVKLFMIQALEYDFLL